MLHWRRLVAHPFLIATFPVVSMWGANAAYVTSDMVVRSLALSLALATLLLGSARLVARTWQKAGLGASLLILVVFSYGHIYGVLSGIPSANELVRHRFLFPVILLVCALAMMGLWKKEEWVSSLTLILNVVGAALVAAPVLSLMLYQARSIGFANEFVAPDLTAMEVVGAEAPDIYYLILDGYGREDVLDEVYGFDNSEFIDALRQRGFYVADGSSANYMQTLLSLGSSLNMDYLDAIVAQNDGRLSVPLLQTLIAKSQVPGFLRSQGYEVVAFEPSFGNLEWADVYLVPEVDEESLSRVVLNINEFETLLLGSTIGRIWLDALKPQIDEILVLEEPYIRHRNRMVYALGETDTVARMPGRKFVIIHVVAPHPPFVFDRSGGMVFHNTPYTMGDGSDFKEGPEEYILRYTNQVGYVNDLALKAVDLLFKNSSRPPVIVVQGDHGPGAYLVWGSVEESNIKERMGILNAYYFPDGDYVELYPEISPVNSFRVILDKYFGTTLGLLPDHHFFSANFDYSIDSSWTVDLVDVDDVLDDR